MEIFSTVEELEEDISVDFDELVQDNQVLVNFDTKANLINSVKLTGTTKFTRLSIGIINSITEKAYAQLKDVKTNEIINKIIAPITNYNAISSSQTALKPIPTFSFLNSNVNRGGVFYNSNNSAFIANLYDNKRKFNFNASIFQSISETFSKTKGFRGGLSIEDLTGSFRFNLGWNGVDAKLLLSKRSWFL